MALADHFIRADVLESLSWMGLSQEARVAKLAHLYLEREDSISYNSRRYEGPTKNTVGLLMRSMFQPPRGLGKHTVEMTLKEIERQRSLRRDRKQRPPEKPRKPSIRERRNTLASRLYVINDCQPNVVGVTSINDCFLALDGGGYYTNPRVYLKHKPTNRVKVVVLDRNAKATSITNILVRMAPKKALRGMFGGKPITLDFEGEGFLVNGELVPWRNVVKIYRGRDEVRNTDARPDRSR